MNTNYGWVDRRERGAISVLIDTYTGDVIQAVSDGRIEYIEDGSVYIYDRFNREVVSWTPDEYYEMDGAFDAAEHACRLAQSEGVEAVRDLINRPYLNQQWEDYA